MIRRLWSDETGLTTVEYALLLAIMALAAFVVATMLGAGVRGSAQTTVSATE